MVECGGGGGVRCISDHHFGGWGVGHRLTRSDMRGHSRWLCRCRGGVEAARRMMTDRPLITTVTPPAPVCFVCPSAFRVAGSRAWGGWSGGGNVSPVTYKLVQAHSDPAPHGPPMHTTRARHPHGTGFRPRQQSHSCKRRRLMRTCVGGTSTAPTTTSPMK